MKKRTKTTIKKSCDKLWSKIIRSKGHCEICRTTQNLEAHHIVTRSRIPTRWDVDNGICLCSKHHKFCTEISAHGNSIAFARWFDDKFGPERFTRIQEKSRQTTKYTLEDYLEIESQLKGML